MNLIKDFHGSWNAAKGGIVFEWDVSSITNDRFIYIVGIREEKGTLKIEGDHKKIFDVSNPSNTSQKSTFLQINSIRASVYKMIFCAYSSPKAVNYSDEEILNAYKEGKLSTSIVIMGTASITYVAETVIIDNSKMIRIYLKSDRVVSSGVLGYKYFMGDEEIVNSFPGDVMEGKTTYPPILIPSECELQIVPVDKQFSGNLTITEKKSKLFF